jgi:hypothetical protein
MSTDQYELEYGPNPPGAKYEHTDIDPGIGYRSAVWLVVAMLISIAIVYGTFWFFEGQERATDQRVQQYPLAVGQTKEPPTPRLQTQPFKDVYLLRQGENEKLHGYGWVDKEAGITHIPIERAMDVLIEKGLPARTEAPAGLNQVVQDSSGGRTAAPR